MWEGWHQISHSGIQAQSLCGVLSYFAPLLAPLSWWRYLFLFLFIDSKKEINLLTIYTSAENLPIP